METPAIELEPVGRCQKISKAREKPITSLEVDFAPRHPQHGRRLTVASNSIRSKRIKKLKDDGYPIKKIAKILNLSRNTVKRYLRPHTPQPNCLIDSASSLPPKQWKTKIDWEAICKKRQQGYTAKQLFEEFKPEIS